MNVDGKSDASVVPTKSTNNDATEAPAESIEGRDAAKRNTRQPDLLRAPKRDKRRSLGLAGVRESARNNRELKFTALLHHVNEELLTAAFFNLKKSAAVGVDEVTWHDYEVSLEDRSNQMSNQMGQASLEAIKWVRPL